MYSCLIQLYERARKKKTLVNDVLQMCVSKRAEYIKFIKFIEFISWLRRWKIWRDAFTFFVVILQTSTNFTVYLKADIMGPGSAFVCRIGLITYFESVRIHRIFALFNLIYLCIFSRSCNNCNLAAFRCAF